MDWKGYQHDNLGPLLLADTFEGWHHTSVGRHGLARKLSYHCFLFEDVLLICQSSNLTCNPAKPFSDSDPLRLTGRILLRNVSRVDREVCLNNEHSLTIHYDEEEYPDTDLKATFVCETRAVKN